MSGTGCPLYLQCGHSSPVSPTAAFDPKQTFRGRGLRSRRAHRVCIIIGLGQPVAIDVRRRMSAFGAKWTSGPAITPCYQHLPLTLHHPLQSVNLWHGNGVSDRIDRIFSYGGPRIEGRHSFRHPSARMVIVSPDRRLLIRHAAQPERDLAVSNGTPSDAPSMQFTSAVSTTGCAIRRALQRGCFSGP
jgi:hypothetical protein